MTEDARDVLADAADATNLTRAEEIRLRYAAIVESSDDAIIAKTSRRCDFRVESCCGADVRIYAGRGHRAADHHDHPSRTCTRRSTRFCGVFGPVSESTIMKRSASPKQASASMSP